ADENINFDTVRVAVPEIGVSKEHWASGYIDYANNNSMLELLLNDQGDLEPDAPITRQEVAYLLVRTHRISTVGLFDDLWSNFSCVSDSTDSPYSDLEPDSDEDYALYYRYILAATNVCVFEGYAATDSFAPSAEITRREAAKVACVARF